MIYGGVLEKSIVPDDVMAVVVDEVDVCVVVLVTVDVEVAPGAALVSGTLVVVGPLVVWLVIWPAFV